MKALIFGANSAIAQAIIKNLTEKSYDLFLVSRSSSENINGDAKEYFYDPSDEDSISTIKEKLDNHQFDLIISTIGILHTQEIFPEKNLNAIDKDSLKKVLEINLITNVLIGKYFFSLLNQNCPSVFAFLSARVGSISDNQLGGWYSYRMSKAALNMFIKNAHIEQSRKNKQSKIIGMHPGTVNTPLSLPFQKNVPAGKLFTPDFSAKKILDVISNLDDDAGGKIFAWDGSEILP